MHVLSTKHHSAKAIGSLLLLACLGITANALAGPREQAKRIHDRLVGIPPAVDVLDSMETLVADGDAVGAAMEAMENPEFYNTTVRELATPWTNREFSAYVDLNDSTATVIGMVRDDIPFDQILYEDIVYVGSNGATAVPYAQDNNDHYIDLQQNNVDLSDANNLVQQQQSALPGSAVGPNETAGIMTTRGFAESFFVAGTNRSPIRFATVNFMCMDMEDFRDVTAWPDRIRQDVSRSPGGDSALFLNDCLACHAGLDGLAGGLAYYDFNEDTQQMTYTAGSVHPKFLREAGTFPYGYETIGDSWVNYWRTGPNEFVGWNGPGSGMGAKSLGMELAQTRQFAECQVKNVFRQVCYRDPNGDADHQAVEDIATIFETNNRSMKRIYAETAAYCMGE